MEGRVKGARDAAFRVLNRVEGGDAYADILLASGLQGLSAQDAALATEITNGVLRWKLRLDFAIGAFSAIKTAKLEHRVLNALRIGAYQLLFLTRVPASAAINESVELMKPDRKRAGFVNAVLRKIDAERGRVPWPGPETDAATRISIEYSHPAWLLRRWLSRYGAEATRRLSAANQSTPPRVIRVNTLRTDRGALLERLASEGFGAVEGAYSPDAVEVTGGGRLDPSDPAYYIQDQASQLVALLASPSPGAIVIDACSAPGGKTTHMAQFMRNTGRILALDKSEARLATVKEAAGRLGIGIIETRAADATADLGFAPVADGVLCDAPCSGLGVLRRSPDIKYRRREADIAGLAAVQSSILSNLAGKVRPGGWLVYSVCTFEPEETDGVVRAFLEDHPGFFIEDARDALPEACAPLVDKDGLLRTFPHEHGMDGFFAARLRRG